MNPTYKLQSVVHIPPPIPRFIRDGMDHSDIDGARPRKEKVMEMRDLYNVHDILGAKPRLSRVRTAIHNTTYEDVSQKKKFERAEPYNP